MAVRPAPLVVIRGDLGAGKTSLCLNTAAELKAMHHSAQPILVSWWFNAFVALARELGCSYKDELPKGARPSELELCLRAAEEYPGAGLVAAAQRLGLRVGPTGLAYLGKQRLKRVAPETVSRMAGIWGASADIRKFIIADISSLVKTKPLTILLIDSFSGRIDFARLRPRMISVLLNVQSDVGAARKECGVYKWNRRNTASRQAEAGQLRTRLRGDHVLDTSNITEAEAQNWLLSVILRSLRS